MILDIDTSNRAQLDVIGLKTTTLAEGPEAAHYEVFMQEGAEGIGPGPHSHPWDETFHMVSGEVSYGVGGAAPSVARQGDTVHIPANTVHWFTVAPGGARMLSVSSGDHHSRLFGELHASGIDASNMSPEDVDTLVETVTRHGVSLHAPEEA